VEGITIQDITTERIVCICLPLSKTVSRKCILN
jgi:hypothetical protein